MWDFFGSPTIQGIRVRKKIVCKTGENRNSWYRGPDFIYALFFFLGDINQKVYFVNAGST